MTTTQRPRTSGPSTPPPGQSPNLRGLILVIVGVVLGVILLVKGGGIGGDDGNTGVEIGGEESAVTTTTEAATTTLPVQAPQTVVVVAANGSGVSGLAGKTGQLLAQSGYTQVVTTDSLQPAAASTVFFAPGYEGNAQAIAAQLGIQPAQVQALTPGTKLAKNQPDNAGVLVLIGPELANTVNAATGGGATGGATTTVAGSSGATTTVKPGGATGATTTVKASGAAGGATTTQP